MAQVAETLKTDEKHTLVLLRHGESEWIHKNIYCGWYDSDISREGEREAEKAGQILKENGYIFDEAYTSVLRRAGKTMDILLNVLNQPDIPVYKSWRLNSRHYGALTGLSKGESIRKYSEEQIKLWRRSYDIPPPEITKNHPYFNRILEDPIYKGGPSEEEFPVTESLQQAIERTLSYWNDIIAPRVAIGKRILIVGHMNSLRAIIKAIDRISDEKIMEYNIPTGVPFIYEFTTDMKPTISLKFLGDAEYVRKANEVLTTPGRGFERPKRSKPSILEVYDYLSKKTDPLPTVQSIEKHNEVEIKEIREKIVETKVNSETEVKDELVQKVYETKDEKLETKVDETVPHAVEFKVEIKVDEIFQPNAVGIVEPKVYEIANPKVEILESKVDETVEKKLIDISINETKEKIIESKDQTEETLVQPIEKIVDELNIVKGVIIQKKEQLADGVEKSEKLLETSDFEARDKIHGRDDTVITVSYEAKKSKVASSAVETLLDNISVKEEAISGVISVIYDDLEKVEDKSKLISTSVSRIPRDLISKNSVVESYKEIEEKLSMVTSIMAPSQANVVIKDKETKDKQLKKKETIEIEQKSRTQL